MSYISLKNKTKAPHYNDAGHSQEGEYRFSDYELYEYTKKICEEQRNSDALKVNQKYGKGPMDLIKHNSLIININEFQF